MDGCEIFVDLTTSRHYIGKNAVGIVRTEREIAIDIFRYSPDSKFFFYQSNSHRFVGLSRALAELILFSVDPLPPERLPPEESPSTPSFSARSVIVSCGLVWDHNFLEDLYQLKSRSCFRVVQIMYDIIPIIMPEYCVPGMELRFPKFLLDAAWTADAIYCISESTRTDLRQFLNKAGAPVPNLRRIELGANIGRPGTSWKSVPVSGLRQGNFVLYVSTIEPRKNHQMLFNIWRGLFDERGSNIPTLVFVGRVGWHSNDFINMLKICTRLYPAHVRVLEDISDDQLYWLYDNCRFTVYPSLYEGWGLPVQESFLHGKVCISSSISGTGEASGGLAIEVAPLDYAAWYRAVGHFIGNDDALQRQERLIKAKFRALSWSDAAGRFRDDMLANLGVAEALV